MRLLVLGGTVFLGYALVRDALDRGWDVTTFTRGRSGDPVAGTEAVHGDRTRDLDRLAGRRWDVVVDTCGFDPAVVAASADALSGAVSTYVFVSSLSVYPGRAEESEPVFTSGDGYGEAKAASERAVEARFAGRALHVRAGLILGPRENIGRLPWWLQRIARGGDVLAPGRLERPCWVPESGELADFLGADVERAHESGLACRPVEDTVHGTWDWLQSGGVPVPRPGLPPVGLPPDKERAVLQAVGVHS
jgi:2'-hydroxyisoflavone reductase